MENETCRLCLSYSETKALVLDDPLINKIKECVSVEISPNEGYSTSVCMCCLETVENWYAFRSMCLYSQKILETQAKSKVKDLCVSNKNCKGSNNILIIKQDAPDNKDTQEEAFQKDILDNDHIFSESNCFDNEQNVDGNNDEENIIIKQTCERYTCEFCPNTFEFYTDYLDHQNSHNGEALFCCDKCDMVFSNKQDLVWHEKRHKVTCHICGVAVLKQSLRLHLNKHTDRFKCDSCSLTFTSRNLLKEHITVKHMKLRQHFCDTCGKNFPTRSSLYLHLKIHSDEKEYKCDHCEYAGKTSISLRIHMSKHENGTYICEYCSKIFKSVRNLRDHLNRVHKPNKKYSCDFCSMKFCLRYQVEQHKRTHTGIHPYKCSKCFKTFARSDGLKEHMRTHDNTESYNCEFCGKVFRTKRGLKRHNCVNNDSCEKSVLN